MRWASVTALGLQTCPQRQVTQQPWCNWSLGQEPTATRGAHGERLGGKGAAGLPSRDERRPTKGHRVPSDGLPHGKMPLPLRTCPSFHTPGPFSADMLNTEWVTEREWPLETLSEKGNGSWYTRCSCLCYESFKSLTISNRWEAAGLLALRMLGYGANCGAQTWALTGHLPILPSNLRKICRLEIKEISQEWTLMYTTDFG